MTTDAATAPAIYGRYKGAEWFDHLYKKDIMIIGLGGIGSWLGFLIARIGANIFAYDHDFFESHNGGQVMRYQDIGRLKTESFRDIIDLFSPDCTVNTFGEYGPQSETNEIVLCGLDSMPARKIAFKNWLQQVQSLPDTQRKSCFFQDGRLLAEQLQIFNIPGDRPDLITCYQNHHLPESGQIQEPDCTLKQTTHCAALIASLMTGYLTNWITNTNCVNYRSVPFYYEYLLSLGLGIQHDGPFE